MTTLEQIRAKRSEILAIAEKYHVGDIRVFGSVATGNQTETSDIDFLVKPLEGCTYFDLGGLQMGLSDMFGRRADIVPERAVVAALRDRIFSEAVDL